MTCGFVLLSGDRPTIDKDPDASLVYGIDVADVLAAGATVNAASVARASGVTAAAPGFSGTIVSARISAGAPGTVGNVTLRWGCDNGDVDERTVFFNIRQR